AGVRPRRRRPPGKATRGTHVAEGRSVELRLGRQAAAPPARMGPCLGKAHVDGPATDGLEGDEIEKGAVDPAVALSLPHRRMAPGFTPDPFPVFLVPELAPIVASVLHEPANLRVG